MSRPLFRLAAILQIGIVLLSGCHPTQPFFVASDPARANYLAQSMDIEYADLQVESLPEAAQSYEPYGPGNLPTSFVDLTLEDCISMALQNSKILRVIPGANPNTGSASPQILSAAPGQLPSIWDPALVTTTASSQPLAVDSQGNRISSRSLIRANQVGGVEDALSEFDAQFSAIMGYNTTDRPRNVAPGNVFNPQMFQSTDANALAALSKRMATGTVATARFTTVYSRNNIPTPTPENPDNFGRNVPSDYTTTLELQVNQPLLRGRGTLVNRIPVILARINEDLELHQFETNVRNLVRDVEHAYWDLYCGYRALEAAQSGQNSALELWRVSQARNAVGEDSPESEAQARALFYQFRGQVHTALNGSRSPGNDPGGLIGREALLREKIGWAPTDGQFIRPADEPNVARVHFDWSEVQAEALTRNSELRRHKWAIKQRELELILAKNHILPQFDLVAFYRWVGVGDHFAKAQRTGINFPDPGSTAWEELTGGEYQEVGVRAELTPHAFGKRRPLANIQNARLNLTKTTEELREKEIALMFQLTEAWRQMQASYLEMQDRLAEWLANNDQIEIFDAKIENDVGVLSPIMDELLRAEERRSRAQLQYYQAECEYNKAMVLIHYYKGSLLDLNSICLEEGPWVEKAYWDADERARERASGIYFDYGYTRPGVVSNGPVESGGLTEGSLPRAGFGQAPEMVTPENLDGSSPEEVPASPNDAPEGSEDNTMPPPPVAGMHRTDVMRAAAALPVEPLTESFEWGDLGIGNGQQPAPIVQSGRERPIPAHNQGNPGIRVISSERSADSGTSRSLDRVWQAR